MNGKRKYGLLIMFVAAILLKIFSLFPDAVEKYYSTGIYPVIARIQRISLGWVPFSVGDILYVVCALALLFQLFRMLRTIFRRQITRASFFSTLRKIALWVLIIYVSFNVLWGLNYNRRGVAYQMDLSITSYNTADLLEILNVVVDRLNEFDSISHVQRDSLLDNYRLFDQAERSYDQLATTLPFFNYRTASVKTSLFGYVGDYLGFTGYYNPFSGEAQVNTTVPVYVRPFTTCHEIGHQLGYAKEDEANVAGYLSARSSPNPAFRYSVYFDLYYYAAAELFVRDSILLKPFKARLRPGIRKDYRNLQAFYLRYQNPLEPLIRRWYGNYLRANEQPQGMMSYNEVVAWLIAYYKKYGAPAV